ncbi:MAG: hypothetical protein JO018_02275 [Candidatus Eremiobacteraeota bacterium]|nr:hypothetical protein [Candidatus Eremiobacteraeota bacterium]
MLPLLQRPTAFIPPLISAFLIALITIHVAHFGTAHEADEGTAAHLFQLLMPLQLVIIAVFASVWLPKNRMAALQVLSIQISAAAAVLALVFFLRL